MLDMFGFTLPVFLVIGLGVVAVRSGLLAEDAVRPLNVFVFYFAMPALIAGALARQDVAAVLDLRLIAGWLVCGVAVFGLGMLAAALFGARNLSAMALMGQGSAVGNIGFLALPLTFTVFGTGAAGPITIALIVDLVILIPLSIALLEIDRAGNGSEHGQRGRFAVVGRIARGVFLNPFILSIALGLTLSASGFGLPGSVERFADFLGAAAGPAALFALGVSLAGRRIEGDTLAIGAMSVLKLFVHPALIYLTLAYGFGIASSTAAIFAVIAAMPVAGNVFVIASQYGVFVRRASASVLVSTLVSVVTVSLALSLAIG
ncbi:MAG: AEC family transporter [Pseudomonadota bacterium]